MANDIKTLRTRIKSVGSTLQLTRAMGLVASSKIRRANIEMKNAREYEESLKKVADIFMDVVPHDSLGYTKNKGGRVKLIVIAGDKGLAGGYNANVLRLADCVIKNEYNEDNQSDGFNKKYTVEDIIPIGKRSNDRFREFLKTDKYLCEKFTVQKAKELANTLFDGFDKEEYDKLWIVGTKYVSSMTQTPYVREVLPLNRNNTNKSAKNASVIFEPKEEETAKEIIKEYLTGAIYSAVKEGYAAETAARRMAMDSAEKNASKMIEELKIDYNRARQGAITGEITEIVVGSGM